MSRKASNKLLKNAKINKKDEFYTLLPDIERELKHYSDHFKNKIVYCNCDDVRFSNFFNYFVQNFKKLGIKKLICSCYINSGDLFNTSNLNGFFYEYTGVENQAPTLDDVTFFKEDGDFRSQECIALLKESDIVVTNPPFSLFREYVSQLVEYDKKFIIIGNVNAITYKEIFNLIQNNKAWLGVNLGRGISGFTVPKSYELYGSETLIDNLGNRIISPNNCLWLTNLNNYIRNSKIDLVKEYIGNEDNYPYYDNYEGINVNRTKDIPKDYKGIMGVPITFLHKFNPEQFKIIQFRKGNDGKDLSINGKTPYFRILIQTI